MMKWSSYISSLALGGLVAIFGTVGHRSEPPWGLIMAMFCLLFAALATRYLFGWLGTGIFSLTWVALVQTLALFGPGGSVLIPDISSAVPNAIYGYIWMYGGLVMILVASLVPGHLLDTQTGTQEKQAEKEPTWHE